MIKFILLAIGIVTCFSLSAQNFSYNITYGPVIVTEQTDSMSAAVPTANQVAISITINGVPAGSVMSVIVEIGSGPEMKDVLDYQFDVGTSGYKYPEDMSIETVGDRLTLHLGNKYNIGSYFFSVQIKNKTGEMSEKIKQSKII